eukprot:gene34782-42118_t
MDGRNQAEALENSLVGGPTEEEIRQKWEGDQGNSLLRFQYASVLCRSTQQQDRLEALLHLETLVLDKDCSAYMRDALYLMSVLRYMMGEYEAARSCAEELCRIDPDNPQVKILFVAIRYKHEMALRDQRAHAQDAGWAVGLGLGLAALGLGLAMALRPRK